MIYNIEELNEILLAARLTDAEKDNIKSSIIQFGVLPKMQTYLGELKMWTHLKLLRDCINGVTIIKFRVI